MNEKTLRQKPTQWKRAYAARNADTNTCGEERTFEQNE